MTTTTFVSENLGKLRDIGRSWSQRVEAHRNLRREFFEAARRLTEEDEHEAMVRVKLFAIIDELTPQPPDPGLAGVEDDYVEAIEAGISGEPFPPDNRDPVDLVRPQLLWLATGLLSEGMARDVAVEVVDAAIDAFRDASMETTS